MKQLLLLMLPLYLIACGSVTGEKPTKDDVTKAIKKTWEQEGNSVQEKQTVSISNITFGTSDASNYAQQLEGVPKNALVTHAKIDFTHHKHYSNGPHSVRRIMTAWVYKDQFGEWAVMNIGTKYP